MKPIHRAISHLFIGALALQCAGCAYFNTYYNGKRLYNQARAGHSEQFPDTISAAGGEAATYQRAIDKLTEVVRKYPASRWSRSSLYYIGQSYFYTSEFQKAERKFQEIWEYYPSSSFAPLARLNAAVINWKLGDLDRAATILSPLRNHPDKTVRQRAAYLDALIVQARGDLPEAVISWERYLFTNYSGELAGPARLNYALCLLETGETNNGIRELEIVAAGRARKSYRHQVWLLLAQSYSIAGRSADAAALCAKILSQEPDAAMTAQAEVLLASIKAAAAGLDQAMALYLAVAKKYPVTQASAQAYYSMGQMMEQHQRLDSALSLYKKARTDAGASALGESAMRNATNIALLLSYQKESSQSSREQSAVLQFLMAEHYLFGLSQPDSAIAVYQRVAQSFPEQPLAPKALFAAAWAFERFKGDTVTADSIYRGVIASYPRTRYANGARDRLGLPLDTLVADSEPDIEFKTTLDVAPAAPDTAKVPGKEPSDQEIKPEKPPGPDQQESPQQGQPTEKKTIPGPDDDSHKTDTR